MTLALAAGDVTPRSGGRRGTLLYDEPMARHTSWRVGGPARRFYQAADSADLIDMLRRLPLTEDIVWLGLGSNLLVRDGGLPGTVIATHGALGIIRPVDADTVYAEAGVPCAKLARHCARRGLAGGEFFAGIPGTLGGALTMNAGAFGGATWDTVMSVETVDRHGTQRVRLPADFSVSYRRVSVPAGEWFLGATLKFTPGDSAALAARIKELLAQRNRTQPSSLPSCGSVFCNPTGDYAARIIEACGLKGYCLGGACVAEKHANFIINTGTASALDIERLIDHIAEVVERVHGIRLQPEVRIVGVPALPGAKRE